MNSWEWLVLKPCGASLTSSTRLPSIALVDQHLPVLRLALHDWAIAWDRRSGEAWLAGRAVDGDIRRLRERVSPQRARRSREELLHRLTRLSI